MNDNPIAALERSLATLADKAASAGTLKLVADEVSGVVRALDAKADLAPAREAQVLEAMTSGGKSLGETLAALEALDKEGEQRALIRKIATALGALDVRSREAAKAEAARDEARRPFSDLTRRAHDHARRAAECLRQAERIAVLYRTDIVVTKAGKSALSRCPPPKGTHVAYARSFDVPRAIATNDAMKATRLPGVWPLCGTDFSFLEGTFCALDEDEAITCTLRELSEKADQGRIVLSEGDVERAVAQAQAVLIAEFHKAVGALRELLRHDAQMATSDRDARYPDGEMIFNPTMFPKDWAPGFMNRCIALPVIDGMAMAAE